MIGLFAFPDEQKLPIASSLHSWPAAEAEEATKSNVNERDCEPQLPYTSKQAPSLPRATCSTHAHIPSPKLATHFSFRLWRLLHMCAARALLLLRVHIGLGERWENERDESVLLDGAFEDAAAFTRERCNKRPLRQVLARDGQVHGI